MCVCLPLKAFPGHFSASLHPVVFLVPAFSVSLLLVFGLMQNYKAENGSLGVNFLTEVYKQLKGKKVSFISFIALCHSSIEQETTYFISVTQYDGLVLQP